MIGNENYINNRRFGLSIYCFISSVCIYRGILFNFKYGYGVDIFIGEVIEVESKEFV